MSVLEDRYRSVLRLLPASYRAVWEDEMVATFLDGTRTDDAEEAEYRAYCGRPSRAEVASVAGLAVRLRLGGVEAPARSFAWGEAVRLVALVGLLVHAVSATMGVLQELWIAGWLAWPPVPGEVLALAESGPSTLWDIAWSLTALVWVAAYLALVSGHRRAAKVLAGLALAPAALAAIVSTANLAVGRPRMTSLMLTMWADLLISALVVLALAAFHGDAPPLRPRPWLVAYAVGLVLAPVPGLVFLMQPIRDLMLLDWPGVWSVALVAAGLVHLGGPAVGRVGRAPGWSLALALLAAPVLALRIVSLLDFALSDAVGVYPVTMAIGAVETVAVIAVGVPLAVLAAQTVRGLPSAAPSPAASQTPAP